MIKSLISKKATCAHKFLPKLLRIATISFSRKKKYFKGYIFRNFKSSRERERKGKNYRPVSIIIAFSEN